MLPIGPPTLRGGNSIKRFCGMGNGNSFTGTGIRGKIHLLNQTINLLRGVNPSVDSCDYEQK